MTFGPTKGGKFNNVVMQTPFDLIRRLIRVVGYARIQHLTCSPAFVEASDVISRVLSMKLIVSLI